MSSWTPLIATHVVAASTSLLLGGYQLLRPTKGDRVHALLGRIWVGAMIYTAVSSFGIREIRDGQLSLLHILSIVTLVSLVWGVVAVRRGNIRRHRAAMRGSWFGVVGAFIGAVSVPERRIPRFTVDDPIGAATATACVVALVFALVLGAHRLERRRSPQAAPADDEPAPLTPHV